MSSTALSVVDSLLLRPQSWRRPGPSSPPILSLSPPSSYPPPPSACCPSSSRNHSLCQVVQGLPCHQVGWQLPESCDQVVPWSYSGFEGIASWEWPALPSSQQLEFDLQYCGISLMIFTVLLPPAPPPRPRTPPPLSQTCEWGRPQTRAVPKSESDGGSDSDSADGHSGDIVSR